MLIEFVHVDLDERTLVGPTYDIVGGIRALLEKLLGSSGSADAWLDTFLRFWNVYSILAIIMSLIFFLGFIYAKIRLAQLSAIEEEQFIEAEAAWAHLHGVKTAVHSRWADVLEHTQSDRPNDWKMAIIEADIFLEEALENAGYLGATISDRLKAANPMSLTTLQYAWDAHKVRNQIAHAGADFVLTQRLTQETITKFERTLRELGAV